MAYCDVPARPPCGRYQAQRCPDDFTVIWRGLPIGRIMQPSGLPPNVPQWRWTCNFYGKPGGASGSGVDLDDCKAKFRVA
jgi:hypothetical protein